MCKKYYKPITFKDILGKQHKYMAKFIYIDGHYEICSEDKEAILKIRSRICSR